MKGADEGPKISAFSRVLAWIFVLVGAFVLVFLIADVVKFRRWSLELGPTLLLALGLLVMGPLFLFAAVKGRAPRWFTSLETMHEREAEARGLPLVNKGPSRILESVVTSAVF